MRPVVFGCLVVGCLAHSAWAEPDLTPEQLECIELSKLECIELSKVVDSTLKLIGEGVITATPQQMANLKQAKVLAEQERDCEARPFILGLKGVRITPANDRSN